MGLFSSNKSTSTTNLAQTTNNFDQRSVNDAGGGIIGSGNLVDSSTDYTSFVDSRNMSASFADSRNMSTNIITDSGAFDVVRSVADGVNRYSLAQVDLARDLARSVDAAGTNATSLAMRAQSDAAGFNEAAASRAFDLARSSQAQAYASSGEAIGFTRDTFADVVSLAKDVIGQAGKQASDVAATANAAYASASDTSSGNKTLLYAGIAAVALVGVVVAFNAFKG